jgi:hypothetical protein
MVYMSLTENLFLVLIATQDTLGKKGQMKNMLVFNVLAFAKLEKFLWISSIILDSIS